MIIFFLAASGIYKALANTRRKLGGTPSMVLFYVVSTSQEKKPPQQKCSKALSVNSSFLKHILYDLGAKSRLESFAF